MKNQYTFIGLVVMLLLVTLSHGGALPDSGSILRNEDDIPGIESNTNALVTNEETTTATNTTTSTLTTTTTTAQNASSETTTANTTVTAPTTTVTSTEPTTITTTTSSTTDSTSTTTAPSTTTTAITQSPTTAPPGRKFDGLSFMGGIILTVGLGALGYLVVRYLRRTNRLPYSNLR